MMSACGQANIGTRKTSTSGDIKRVMQALRRVSRPRALFIDRGQASVYHGVYTVI